MREVAVASGDKVLVADAAGRSQDAFLSWPRQRHDVQRNRLRVWGIKNCLAKRGRLLAVAAFIASLRIIWPLSDAYAAAPFFDVIPKNETHPDLLRCPGIAGKFVVIPPVEILLLDDVSATMGNTFGELRKRIRNLFLRVIPLAFSDVVLGYATFYDKAVPGHAPQNASCYTPTYFGLDPTAMVRRLYQKWPDPGGDDKGSQLDAMWYGAHDSGWSSVIAPNPNWSELYEDFALQWHQDKLRVVLVSTKQRFHESPEGSLFGGLPPKLYYDGACTSYDYPTSDSVTDTFLDKGILPIFAIYDDLDVYREFVDTVPGRVAVVNPSATDFDEKVVDAITDILCQESVDVLPTAAPVSSTTAAAGSVPCDSFGLPDVVELPQLELYFLADMSTSFDDDIANYRMHMHGTIDSVASVYPGTRFGFGTYIDKPVSGIGFQHEYCYRHGATLAEDTEKFSNKFMATIDKGTYSAFEESANPLEAIVAAVRNPRVEWTSNESNFTTTATLRLLVVLVDAEYHVAGDTNLPSFEWEVPSHDAFGAFKSSCTQFDFPAVEVVSEVLRNASVIPIFLATESVTAAYKQLQAEFGLPVGAVQQVADDSSNFFAAVEDGITEVVCKAAASKSSDYGARGDSSNKAHELSSSRSYRAGIGAPASLVVDSVTNNSTDDAETSTTIAAVTSTTIAAVTSTTTAAVTSTTTAAVTSTTTAATTTAADISLPTTTTEDTASGGDAYDANVNSHLLVVGASAGGFAALALAAAAAVSFAKSAPPQEFDLELETRRRSRSDSFSEW